LQEAIIELKGMAPLKRFGTLFMEACCNNFGPKGFQEIAFKAIETRENGFL